VRVALREAWPAEDENFTPWLAAPQNISLLSETLNMDLEVEAVEHYVGAFKADILARDVDEPAHRVIIENQFGRTNHGHLGQVLTYLAGVDGAKTIVWIAEVIQPDHRAAIDWLNLNTTEEFSFFAIEIELWRIENSLPAPRFNVVASPNDWTRTVRAESSKVNDGELANRHRIRLAYWASFADFLRERSSEFKIRRPNKDNWFSFAIGRAGFIISATITTEKSRVGVELYRHDDPGKVAFRELLEERDQIEKEFGEPLEWQELPGKKAMRIVIYKHDVDPADQDQYADLHNWMLSKMTQFRKVFALRVRNLILVTASDEEQGLVET
jgi:hypothetical protein